MFVVQSLDKVPAMDQFLGLIPDAENTLSQLLHGIQVSATAHLLLPV